MAADEASWSSMLDGGAAIADEDDGPGTGAMGLEDVGPETRRFWRGLEGCKCCCLSEVSAAAESAG